MLSLQEFIEKTFTEIAEAVSRLESQGRTSALPESDLAGELAEKAASSSGLLYLGKAKGFAAIVKFDVAVTAEAKSSGGGEFGISVYSFKAGVDGRASSANSSVSRVQFALPLQVKTQRKRQSDPERTKSFPEQAEMD